MLKEFIAVNYWFDNNGCLNFSTDAGEQYICQNPYLIDVKYPGLEIVTPESGEDFVNFQMTNFQPQSPNRSPKGLND